MASDIIERATAYWSEKRRGRRMPARRDIDPADLAGVLENVVVVEAIDGGRDYMHRIAGARAEALMGASLHGARLSGLAERAQAMTAWRNGLNLARSLRAPHFAVFPTDAAGHSVQAVFLPLSRQGADEAEFVLGVLVDAEESPDA